MAPADSVRPKTCQRETQVSAVFLRGRATGIDCCLLSRRHPVMAEGHSGGTRQNERTRLTNASSVRGSAKIASAPNRARRRWRGFEAQSLSKRRSSGAAVVSLDQCVINPRGSARRRGELTFFTAFCKNRARLARNQSKFTKWSETQFIATSTPQPKRPALESIDYQFNNTTRCNHDRTWFIPWFRPSIYPHKNPANIL